MSSSNPFGSLLSALKAAGASTPVISAAISGLGSALNSTSSQVNAKLAQVASLTNNPTAYVNAVPGIINTIETIPGLPQGVYPLLEGLRPVAGQSAIDVLKVAQTITEIEAEVAA